jgi:hypothetical protein
MVFTFRRSDLIFTTRVKNGKLEKLDPIQFIYDIGSLV